MIASTGVGEMWGEGNLQQVCRICNRDLFAPRMSCLSAWNNIPCSAQLYPQHGGFCCANSARAPWSLGANTVLTTPLTAMFILATEMLCWGLTGLKTCHADHTRLAPWLKTLHRSLSLCGITWGLTQQTISPTWWGEILNLPDPSGFTRPWGLLNL
jgi:thiosulfate reductase cytochrome b subunit